MKRRNLVFLLAVGSAVASVQADTVVYTDSQHPPIGPDAGYLVVYLDDPERLQRDIFGELSADSRQAEQQARAVLQSSGWQQKEQQIAQAYQGVNYLTVGSQHDRNPAPESGAFYARIRHERYLNGQTQTHAITGCPTLSPGQVLKVTGGNEVADVFAQGVVVTAMHSHARRDEDFGVNFDGIPDNTDFSFRPEPGSRPVMAGTLPARITSTTENDTCGHIDKDGRYP